MKLKKIIIILIAIASIALLIFVFRGQLLKLAFSPTTQPESDANGVAILSSPELIAQDLRIPWSIAVLPDGDLLVTERNGNLRQLGRRANSVQIPAVKSDTSEGGLLGVILHPRYEDNQWIYLYFTTSANGQTINRVTRYTYQAGQIGSDKIIVDNIPGAAVHDGGRMQFGPDGLLYIATGDARDSSLAQNTNSLAGKILRVTDDGSIPPDNPFGNAVYSYGHRNVQGLAFDDSGNLWATEHGRSGIRSGLDELNLIEKGGNYGWPEIEGDETAPGMLTPKLHSGPNTTWAPAGLVIVSDNVFFAGLRGQSLYHTRLSQLQTPTANFFQTYGRLRALTYHDGYLYFSTSNLDGRGEPKSNDDKIYRIKLQF